MSKFSLFKWTTLYMIWEISVSYFTKHTLSFIHFIMQFVEKNQKFISLKENSNTHHRKNVSISIFKCTCVLLKKVNFCPISMKLGQNDYLMVT